MQVPVVLQDHVLRLPLGRPQLHVLLVSGAVRQCRAPDPTGRAVKDTWETSRRRGEEEREAATRERKGGTDQGACGGTGDGERKRHGAKQRPTPPSADGNQREGEDVGRRRVEGKSGRGRGERR